MEHYSFPEDYDELSEDFLTDRHMFEAGPGKKVVSATVEMILWNRIKMLSLIYDESISGTIAFILNLGCSQMEVLLKEARQRSEMEKEIQENEL